MKKRFLAVFLALALCLGLAPATAFAAAEEFVIKDGVLTEYNGPGGDVIIPDGVVGIGDGAFKDCTSLTSVTIPDSVTSIDRFAFLRCTNLTNVTIPPSVVSIDHYAFAKMVDSEGGFYISVYLAFFGRAGSYAETYAQEKGILFVDEDILRPFTDLKPNAYYLLPVSWAITDGITIGTTATTFSPDQDCTHGEILTFLWRAAEEPESSAQPPIALKGDEFYYKAVKWAAEKGMIDKNFNPSAPCTRADAVNYIYQAFGNGWGDWEGYDGRFTDVPADAAYAQAVDWAVTLYVTNGTSVTTFSPNKICNRGEIITFLHRYCVILDRLQI